MSQAHHHEDLVSKPVLIMVGGIALFALAMTTAVRVGLLPAVPSAPELRAERHTPVAQERTLRFIDAPDGSVRVIDVANGREVARFGSEGGGFVRGVLRGLARDRGMRGIGAAPPFRLAQWQDGALTLTDTATGRVIELGSFGPTNRATFAKLLEGAR